jgi:ADP-L-glycero-D-manno-heptose 6-epimerase
MIIVTGGAGFIGSAIVAELNSRGQSDILIVDELGRDEKWKNLRKLRYSDYMEKDDFLDAVQADALRAEVEAVIHMGACSSTTEKDASYLVRNNFEYTQALAEWAVDDDVRFIYASSAATYGDGSRGFSDDEDALEELIPLNMYGYSKHMFDLWAKRQGFLDRIAGLKFFNVYGPNEYHKAEMRSFVNKAYWQITEKGKVGLFKSYLPQYPDGGQKRDFIYIRDAVAMTLFFLEQSELSGIYNIGTGEARTWNDLAAAVFAAMGWEKNIEYIEMPEELRGKYQYFTQADMGKLRAAGYRKPVTKMEDAVRDYIASYLMKDEYLGA